MSRLIVITLLVCSSLAASAEEPPPEVKRFFKESAAVRSEYLRLYQVMLAETEKQLSAVEQGTIASTATAASTDVGRALQRFASAETKQELIDKLTERRNRLAEVVPALMQDKAWPLYSFKLPLKVGSIGTGGLSAKVERVINDDTFIARWRPLDDDGIAVWVTGQSSSRLAVGEKIVIGNRFELWHVRGVKMKRGEVFLELSHFSLELIRPFLKEGEIFVSYPGD